MGVGMISCQEEIILDLPDTPARIIVNGRISDTLNPQVQVFASAPYFSSEVPGISSASVLLFEDGVKVDSLVETVDLPGYYTGSYLGTVGSEYHIEVTIPQNHELLDSGTWVSYKEELRRCPPIDSFYSVFREEQLFQPEGYYVVAHFNEPPGVGDLYRVRAWRNDSLQNDPFDITILTDEFTDGFTWGTAPFPALTIDGPRPVGTTYRIELGSITHAYSDFLEILQQQTGQVGSPFDPPPASVIGNIYRKGNTEDVALGYFNASKLHYAETVIVE